MFPTAFQSFRSWQISLLLLPLLLLALAGTARAELVGRLTRVDGVVDIMPGGHLPAVPARDGGAVQKGDFIRTKSNARAEITFNDGSVVKIAQRSRIDVSEYSASARKLGLPRGKVQAIVVPVASGTAAHSFEIRTPNAIAGVRGTSFYVYHQGNVTGVAVLQGVVHTASLAMPSQGVTLVAGTGTMVTTGHAPTPPRPLSATELNSHQKDVTPAATKDAGSGQQGGAPSAAQSGSSGASPSPASGTSTTTGSATTTAAASSSDAQSPTTAASAPGSGATPIMETVFSASSLDIPLQQAASPLAGLPVGSPSSTTTQADTTVTPPITDTIKPILPDPTPVPVPTPPPTALTFSSTLAGGLMSRGASIDPNSNLLTIINDPGLTLTLSGTTSLWTGGAQASLSGIYPKLPLQQPNHYWLGNLYSNSTANHTTADGGAYFGYFGAMSLDGTGVTNTALNALYLDPTGKTGIMRGALPGLIAGGVLKGAGALSLTEMNAASGLNPASLSANWWDSKTGATIGEVTGPALTQLVAGSATSTGNGNRRNESEGFMVDAALNITGNMSNRGDVLRLGFLRSDPSFGIWSRESFGTCNGGAAQFVLSSNADWGTQNADGSFTTDHAIKIISLGNWQTGGSLTGTADGVWGDLKSGSLKLLTGTLTGSSNPGSSSFGAVTTGSFIDLARFLANPALAGQLGFPTLKGPVSISLSGSNATGGVAIGNISFFSRNAADPVTLWIATNLTGSYTGGLQQQRFSLMDGASATGSTVFGTMQVTSVSSANGHNSWLGSLNAIGETGAPFRSQFDGIVAGSFTGTSFTGSAAGLAHPVTYYSTIGGAQTGLTRYFNGAATSYGSVDGVMGGMSLWGSTPTLTSDFKGIGFITPSQPISVADFVLIAPIRSQDIPSGSATTADGGAYRGYLVAGVSTTGGGPNSPPINGVMNALSIDPSGDAGVLRGKIGGYLDPMTNVWNADGKIFPVTLSAASAGVTAATLNSPGGVTTIATPFAAGTVFNGTPAPTGWVADVLTRSFITSHPDWGIGQFGLYTPYSAAPAGAPWNMDFYLADSSPAGISLAGSMSGDQWDPATGKLHAYTRGAWHDLLSAQPAATPMTGIFIGETVGTFNPLSLQAVTSGIWLETGKFLGLAATAAGQATLQKLNIPAVEVGKADFTGGNTSFDVTIRDLRFFAPVSGARPQLFASDGISGNYFVASPSGTVNLVQTPGAVAVSGITPSFSIDKWDATANKWSATLATVGNNGVVAGNGNIQFKGPAAGRTSGGATGTFTGTAAGSVR